jgi:beta-galactosidase
MGIWKEESNHSRLMRIEIDSIDNKKITLESHYQFNNTHTSGSLRHTFFPDGKILFDIDLKIPDEAPDLPRIGLQIGLNKELNEIEWYGRGPHENYSDRKTSAAVGIYQSSISEWITSYVRPQENGNRCAVRWIKFGSFDGIRYEFTANSDHFLSVSAWPYSQEVLENSTHDINLRYDKQVLVNIDLMQMGVGGDNSWGLPVLDQYLIKPGHYSYSFMMQSVSEQHKD